jgi:hypothetical protein
MLNIINYEELIQKRMSENLRSYNHSKNKKKILGKKTPDIVNKH